MMILVSGGSKCGKSRFAENLFSDFCGEKIYLATMIPVGEEAGKAIERHKKMRFGKGFSTLEKYTDIDGADIPDGCGILLEDMGNLLANEMFSEENSNNLNRNFAEKILFGIEKIQKKSGLFVIVTNNVFSDGINYPPETALYIKNLSEVNTSIAERADRLAECVYGIPIMRKAML